MSVLIQEQEGTRTKEFLQLDETYGAHNYHPLPVVLTEEGECGCGMSKIRNTLTC